MGRANVLKVLALTAALSLAACKGEDAALKTATQSMPDVQKRFIETLVEARKKFNDASNDLVRGAARVARARSICSTLGGFAVTNWIGVVHRLSSNSDGFGVLTLRIGDDIMIGTWNNSFSDMSHSTLIKPDSPAFKAATALKEDMVVRFSGRFFPRDTDCLAEQSVTQAGAMTAPEFVFRFSLIQPAQ